MRSLFANLNLLRVSVIDMMPKIILLSETRTVDNMVDAELKLCGYKIFRCDSLNRHTGGVVIYTHDLISAHVIFKYNSNFIWCLAIKIDRGFENDVFCVVYRGHQCIDSDFVSFFSELSETLSSYTGQIHIVGDFNYDYNKHKISKSLRSIAKSYNLKQLISEPTRVTNESSSIIDWYLTDRKNVSYVVSTHSQISDHHSIIINIKHHESVKKKIKVKDYSRYSRDNLVSELNKINWNEYNECDNVNKKSDFIFCNLEKILDDLIGYKEITILNSIKWYNSELHNLKIKRNQLHSNWTFNKCDLTWNAYKQARNFYKNALQEAEKNYLMSEINNNRSDPKKLWRILKSCYSDTNCEPMQVIEFDNGEIETDGKIICEKLNNYFVDSIVNIANNVPCALNNFDNPISVDSKFNFVEISENELRILVAQSKKKNFLNNISGKSLCDAICHVKFRNAFLDLINYSLTNGVFPDAFKSSVIIPLQKVKNTIKCNEIRPINRMRIEESILERVVKVQVVKYLEDNNLFMPEQSGFRQKHSCESALTKVIYEWKKCIDSNKITIAVFLDLKRAFETIDRNLLITKMKNLGFHDIVLAWFESFLTYRKQRTKFNSEISREILISIGIPQGSVLSCILFIIFINDIKSIIKYCDINFFADDGLIQITCDNLSDGLVKLKYDLKNIYQYLCYSRLSLNTSKTKFMIVSNKKITGDVELMINSEKIERVSEFKYLGVVLDERLSFNPLTDDLCKKINKKFAIFKRCEKKLTLSSKLTFYTSLVQSQIDTYGSTLYSLNQTQLSRLQLIQNRFMRTILRAESRRSIASMLDDLQIMSVKQRVNWNSLKYIHKIKQGYAPEYLLQLISMVGDSHSYDTRQKENFYISHANLVSTDRSVLRDGLRVYNQILTSYRREKDEEKIQLGIYNYLKYFVKLNF